MSINNEKLYKMDNDNIEVFLDSPNCLGEFGFNKLRFKDKDITWVNSLCDQTKTNCFSIQKYLSNYIDKLLKDLLKQYINENINNYDIYKNFHLLSGSYISNIDIEQKINKEFLIHLYFTNIYDGIVIIHMNDYDIYFNLYNNKIEQIKLSYDNCKVKEDKYILLDIFRIPKDRYLLNEQYNKGIALSPFQEIIKLNDWLYNKKSIKLIFKDKSIYTLKDECLSAFSFIDYKNKNFYIKDNYDFKPYIKEFQYLLDELDYLQYRNKKYVINIHNLKEYKDENQ